LGEITKQDIYDAGMKLRREVLGDEYVDRVLAIMDEFSADVQEYLTTHAWGATWARSTPEGELTLPKKTRSIMNLAMLAVSPPAPRSWSGRHGGDAGNVRRRSRLSIPLAPLHGGAPGLHLAFAKSNLRALMAASEQLLRNWPLSNVQPPRVQTTSPRSSTGPFQ